MTRAKISEYSATAGDNTDVNGVNIAEGCPPSSMNNMGREIMAALKRFQTGSDGDGVTVGGSLVVSGSTTVNTFNVDVISEKTSAAGVTIDGVLLKDSLVGIGADGSASAPAIYRSNDTNTGIFFPAADTIAFAEGGAEAMRIDSDGDVGIGTTSPGAQLEVSRSATNGFSTMRWSNTGASGRTYEIGLGGNTASAGFANNLYFYDSTAAATRMVIDSSGNVLVNTTTAKNNAPGVSVKTSQQGFIIFNGVGSSYNELGVWDGASDDTKAVIKVESGLAKFGSRTNSAVVFQTNDTERARITSGGYFKASDTGAYNSNTGAYHEFIQTANETNLFIRGTNASFSSSISTIRADRSATSSYNLLQLDSGNGADTEFIFRGDGNAFADGTFQNNGADYAEFFESANGEALTLGATVVLDGNKVREATEEDPASAVIGVVRPKEPSKASMIIGNTAWNKWANKYLSDDFDRYIMEDHDVVEWEEQVLEKEATEAVEAVVDEDGNEVSPAIPAQEATYKTISHSYESHNIPEGITVPEDATVKTHDDKGNKFQHYKLNPAWDKDSEYTPREQRPEWNIIGLVGQVKVLKGQPTNDRWVKMRDVSETVEEWFVR